MSTAPVLGPLSWCRGAPGALGCAKTLSLLLNEWEDSPPLPRSYSSLYRAHPELKEAPHGDGESPELK